MEIVELVITFLLSLNDNFQERVVPLEAEGVANVIEACGRAAAYEKRCIFTSSLLSSIWKDGNVERVVDETSWSDEGFCRENQVLQFLFIFISLTLLEPSSLAFYIKEFSQ